MRRSYKTEATLLTHKTGVIDLNGGTAGCTATKKVSKLIEIFENISGKNNSSKTRVKSRRSTNSARNRSNYSSTWTTQRSANFSRNGIICHGCGRNLKCSRGPTTLHRPITTSTLGFVIENSSRRRKHGVLERQVMFHQTKLMLKKGRQGQHGKKEVMLLDCIALQRHDVSAARIKRLQNAKHWILRLKTDGSESLFDSDQICRCIKTMPQHARRSIDGNATISQMDTSRTSTTSTRRSTLRRRRKLRLPRMVELQRVTMKPVDSVFIFNIAVAKFTVTAELELRTFHIIWQTVTISVSREEFPNNNGTSTHKKHLCNTWS